MSYSEEVKQLAYKLDEECWIPYTGEKPDYKRAMDKRRALSLEAAERYLKGIKTLKEAHRLEDIVNQQFTLLDNAIGPNPPLLRTEKGNANEAIEPKKYTLHGKKLRAHDAVVYGGDTFNVEGFAHDGTVKIKRGGLEVYIPQNNVGRCLSWPKGAPDTRAELQHYYDTVIAEMCKGTTVEPWECVRASFPDGSKAKYKVAPDFKGYDPAFYEFAVTVHLNRPVWVGSVLYVKEGLENFMWPLGEECRVVGFTEGGNLKLALQHERVVSNYWRTWAVWEKPVKQKVPQRVVFVETEIIAGG